MMMMMMTMMMMMKIVRIIGDDDDDDENDPFISKATTLLPHTPSHHVRVGNHRRECHSYGQFSLVSDHRHQLNQAVKAVCKGGFCKSFKLGSLLQDLREHLHEGRFGLRVPVVAQAWRACVLASLGRWWRFYPQKNIKSEKKPPINHPKSSMTPKTPLTRHDSHDTA